MAEPTQYADYERPPGPYRPNPVVPERVRKRHPDSHYRAVAEIYREAVEAGDKPGLAIAQTWSIPMTTARRWAKVARERGYISGPWTTYVCRGCRLHGCPMPPPQRPTHSDGSRRGSTPSVADGGPTESDFS